MADGSVSPLISAWIMQRRSSNQESSLGFFCAGQAEPYQEYLFFPPHTVTLISLFPEPHLLPPAALLIISCPHPSSFYYFFTSMSLSIWLLGSLLSAKTQSHAPSHTISLASSQSPSCPQEQDILTFLLVIFPTKGYRPFFSSSTPNLLRLVLFSSFHHLTSPSPIC